MIDRERLAAFLFRIARDEVTFGAIEGHVLCVERYHAIGTGEVAEYLDAAEPLGLWARYMAERLVPDAAQLPDPEPCP